MTKIAICALVAVTLSCLLCAQSSNSALAGTSEGYRLTATVKLIDKTTRQPEHDLSGAAVWLVPLDGQSRPQSSRSQYRMLQHDKHFEPSLLVVPVGSSVEFPNLDPWFHNVFSMYRGKRFDLGLYQAGAKKAVRFDRPGPSFIFCNIHPEMTAVVLAVQSPFFAVSDKSGNVVINDVPSGRYELRVWHEHADSEAVESIRRNVLVGEKNRNLGALEIPVKKDEHKAHKNKYGQDYDSKTLDQQY